MLLSISCNEKKGIDLLIENTIESNFTLLLNIFDENENQLLILNIPINNADII